MLTPEQITDFKRQGFLILPGLIEPAVVDFWRRRFRDHLGLSDPDPTTWPREGKYVVDGFEADRPDANFGTHPKILAILQQLGGEAFVPAPSGGALVQWPRDTTAWRPTPWGHVDGYPPTQWFPFMVAFTTYLYDVEPMGGGFTFWPGSHVTTHQHFRQHPDMIDGAFSRTPEFNWGGPNDFTRIAPEPSREFTGRAGDVIIWHSFLVHTGSTNVRRTPRVALFSRVRHREQEAIKYEVPEDLWKYWMI